MTTDKAPTLILTTITITHPDQPSGYRWSFISPEKPGAAWIRALEVVNAKALGDGCSVTVGTGECDVYQTEAERVHALGSMWEDVEGQWFGRVAEMRSDPSFARLNDLEREQKALSQRVEQGFAALMAKLETLQPIGTVRAVAAGPVERGQMVGVVVDAPPSAPLNPEAARAAQREAERVARGSAAQHTPAGDYDAPITTEQRPDAVPVTMTRSGLPYVTGANPSPMGGNREQRTRDDASFYTGGAAPASTILGIGTLPNGATGLVQQPMPTVGGSIGGMAQLSDIPKAST